MTRDHFRALCPAPSEQARTTGASLEQSHREHQRERERLHALFEEAPFFLTLVEGRELRVTMVNRRTREQPSGALALGKTVREMVPSDNPLLTTLERVFATGIAETSCGLPSYFPAGGHPGRYFTRDFVPLRDENGKVDRILVSTYEITEEVRARHTHEALETQTRHLEAARREAVDASRAKDEFLAMLGHELRNPLAPMFTTLELMRLRGTASREIDVLERQVRHLARLVEDLLDTSRIKRGLIELKRRDLDLRSVVRRALETTNPLIEQRQNRIITDLAPVAVHGDPDRLAQAVGNLITNAAKYSEIGAPIRIFTHRTGQIAKLVVADEGVGIAPDMIGRVFDAFAQQPQMLARSHGGLGLGLSIVKSLVEAHGGTVSAQSDGPGKGSAFGIELPAITPSSRAVDTPPPPPPFPATTTPKRILVVDDNRDAATALRDGLQAMGHIVAIAHDAPSALAEASAFKPQIGVLDIGLPVMDGYELAGALRATHDIRLIAITGYGQESDRQRSREAGFDSHLVKPVGLQQLGALLNRIPAGGSRDA